MFPLDIIRSTVIDRVEDALDTIEYKISFENPLDNQWNIIVSFDLDSAAIDENEKKLIGALLKHL